jgi:CheY-like chemotaxis protein
MTDLPYLEAVLAVEDDFLIALDLQRALRDLGCKRVEITGSCSEALDLAGTGAFDLVVVDVKLSDADCSELVKVLRNRSIPFVYVSGYQQSDYPDLPSAPWLTKPLNEPELAAAIRTIAQQLA